MREGKRGAGRVALLAALLTISTGLSAQPPVSETSARPQAALAPDIRPFSAEEQARADRLWRSISRYVSGGGHSNALKEELPQLLALLDQTYGPQHPLTLSVRLVQAGSLAQTTQHEEAERLFARTQDALQRRAGPEAPAALATRIDRATNLIQWGRPQEAEALLAPLQPIFRRDYGENSLEHARLQANLAYLRDAQGRFAEAEQLARQALAIRATKLKPDDPLLASTRARIANALVSQGNYEKAERLLAEAMPGDPPAHLGGARLVEARGDLRAAQGRFVDAEKDLTRAGLLFVEHAGYSAPESKIASAKARLAATNLREMPAGGWNPESGLALESIDSRCREPLKHLAAWWEARVRAAAESFPATAVTCRRLVADFAEKNFGAEHPGTGEALHELTDALQRVGAAEEAEKLARRALAIRVATLGNTHPETTRTLALLGEVLGALGKSEEAEALALRGGGSDPLLPIRQSLQQAALLQGSGRFEEAEPLWSDIDRAFTDNAQDLRLAAQATNGSSFNKLMTGRCAELRHTELASAAETLRKLNPIDFAVTGRSPLEEALAFSEACQNKWAAAAARLNTLSRGERGRLGAAWYYSRDTALLETRRSLALVRSPAMLAQAAEAAQNAALIALQRRYIPTPGGDKVGGALRLPNGAGADPLAAAFVAQLKTQWALVQRDVGPAPDVFTSPLSHAEEIALIGAGQEVPKAPVAREGHLGATALTAGQNLGISAAAQALLQAAARTKLRDPALTDLVQRQQALMEQVAFTERNLFAGVGDIDPARMRTLEAVKTEVEQVTAQIQVRDPRYVELVRPGALDLAKIQERLKPGEAMLYVQPAWDDIYVFAIGKRRFHWHKMSIETAGVDEMVRQLRCQLDGASCQPGESSGSFDFAIAHELYRELVKPVEAALEGVDQLYVVASGSVGGLPLGLLVTEPVQGASYEQMRSLPWLADRYATVTLPSVSSLRAFDAARGRTFAAELTGYGNPVLGPPADPAPTRSARRTGTRFADAASLKAMPSLPGTERELLALAQGLGVPRDALYLAGRATEAAVKRDRGLRDSRVVAFATHGVLPGGAAGLQEPGLVFTPPSAATTEDDGLLTASEAASLTLHADWLILSACNTAASDGRPGGEALSGLARAFLYAGARSLLVSHWQVSDDATAALTVEALRIARTRPELSRAQAMQASMRAVRTGRTVDGVPLPGWKADWADPWYWAPFVLIDTGS